MQIKSLETKRLSIFIIVLFVNLITIFQEADAQVVQGPVFDQLLLASGVNAKDSLYWSESYIAKYIRRQIYEGDMIGKYAYNDVQKSDYMPQTFSLKYKNTTYPKITYNPNEFYSNYLNQYNRYIGIKKEEATYKKTIQYTTRPINKVIQQAAISHPMYVQYLWNEIPDVSDVGKRKLSRRAVEKAITTLLKDTFNTKPSLEQIVIAKSPWEFGGKENIQLSQGYLNNWTKGGESNIALSSDLRMNANFTKGKHSWENYIVHKVGIMSSESESGRVNDDLIEINTKYGLQSSKKWYYSFLYNFKSQFFYGYENSDKEHIKPISGFFAPAYMSFAIGMDYKPSNKFTLLLSPLTSRLTVVSDTVKFDQTRYGIDEDKKANILNGLSIVNSFNYQLTKEINLTSKVDIFYEYLNAKGENQKQIDWELIVDMKINQFLTTRLLGNLRYFTTESDQVQIRENFNIAFQYHF
nr:DUF3078 domain-containing protein [uncultured Carboxylicivirga sp.]